MEIEFRSNIFFGPRKLVISPELVSFCDTGANMQRVTQFTRGEVAAFKFGVRPLRGYFFYVGRRYYLDIRGLDDRVIKIRLLSLYGFRKKATHERFNCMLRALFDSHQRDILNYYLEIFKSGIRVDILDTSFTQAGITFSGKEIPWGDVGSKAYTTYYALFSKSDPKTYKSYSYLNDWNTAIVYNLSRWILRDKNLPVTG